MRVLFFTVLIGLCLPCLTWAGEIQRISFNNARVTVAHSGCEAGQPIREPNKIILPFYQCVSNSGQLPITDNAVQKIHWAQHAPQEVWIVVTLAQAYPFQVNTQPNQYQICFPHCGHLLQQQALNALTSGDNMELKSAPVLFTLNNKSFIIPLENVGIEQFLDRSIGYVPRDVVRDGLPHFGSLRDDWQGKARKHLGYDIYVDNRNVLAMSDGVVTRVSGGSLAGLYIKLHHGNQLYTLYIHLQESFVKEGQYVKQGQVIGLVKGPSGNAVEAQLHLEVKINDISTDPLPFIKDFYRQNPIILQKIQAYESVLPQIVNVRRQKVQQYLAQ